MCSKCQEPRPSPLPVVPCALLPQEYYRIAGHKPKEWKASSRNNVVIRVQEAQELPIHQDLQTWQVSFKARKIDEQIEADRQRREGVIMSQVEVVKEDSHNQPALLAAPLQEEDKDDGMRHTLDPMKGRRHLLSSHLETRSTKTALVGNDGSWQMPLLEIREGAEEVEANEEVVTDEQSTASGGHTTIVGDASTAIGAGARDESGLQVRRLFAGQGTMDDDEEVRPPTPELGLDQLAYLQCMHVEMQKRTGGQEHAATAGPRQGSAGEQLDSTEVAANGKGGTGGEAKAVGGGEAGHGGVGGGVEVEGGGVEGEGSAGAVDQGRSDKEGGQHKTLLEMWAKKRDEVLRKLGLRQATGPVGRSGREGCVEGGVDNGRGAGGGGGWTGKSEPSGQHGAAGGEEESRVAAVVLPVAEQVVDVRLDAESDQGGLWQVMARDAWVLMMIVRFAWSCFMCMVPSSLL